MTKYEEFKSKKKHIAQNWGMKCDSEHLWELADEMLETIKELEKNSITTLNEGVAYELKIQNKDYVVDIEKDRIFKVL